MSYDRSPDAPEVATNGRRIARDVPADPWEGLWPSRKGLGPWGTAEPKIQAPGTPARDTPDHNQAEAALELKIAELSRAMEARHAQWAQETASALDAIRAVMDTALAGTNDTVASVQADVLRAADARAELAASMTESERASDARSAQLAQRTAAALDAIRAEHAHATARATTLESRLEQLAASVSQHVEPGADVDALRAELAAAVAEQAALARTEALERAVVREAAVEARLRSELDDIVTHLPELRLANEANQATSRKVGEVTDHLGVLADGFAKLQARVDDDSGRLRSQLAASEATLDERLEPLARNVSDAAATVAALTSSVQTDAKRITALQRQVRKGADAVTRADLAELKTELDRLGARDFTSAHAELDRRMSRFDEVIDAVDAAVAGLDTGWAERLTGLAQAAAKGALAPLRTDLGALQADMEAVQQALSQLERRARPEKPRSTATKRATSPKTRGG